MCHERGLARHCPYGRWGALEDPDAPAWGQRHFKRQVSEGVFGCHVIGWPFGRPEQKP